MVTLFAFRQDVQTSARRGVLPSRMRMRCRLGSQRRNVFLAEWLTLWPVMALFPQISHARAMADVPPNTKGAAEPDGSRRREDIIPDGVRARQGAFAAA